MSFQIGEIIVRDDSRYPEGALVVDGFDTSGHLLAHPLGGGCQLRIPKREMSRFAAVAKLERTPIFRRAVFEIEGVDNRFQGWSQGKSWNGWAMPHFEFEQAEKVVAMLGKSGHYEADQDAFVTLGDDGEEETWCGEVIDLPDGGHLKAYPVGAGSWIWDELEGGDQQWD